MRVKHHILHEEQRRDLTKMIATVVRQDKRVLFTFLHGSFLDGPFFRDIDLGVFVKDIESIDFWDYECGLSQRIEKVLGHPFPVEAKIINGAPISFCYHVIRGRLLFVRDESVMVDFMTRVASLYLDMAPLRRKYMLEAME
ncbi:MAG: hypothetical protein B6240_05860 [Desulfobacteraceae bacterium 4572_87]|nr:MAG: hypothetical protein B6240_05860 [Desulfobacteraceae bacterium 4572_87]